MLAVIPTVLHSQNPWGVAVGTFGARVDSRPAVLSATLDVAHRFSNPGRFIALRSYWWKTSPASGGVGIFYGGRGSKWRFLHADAGVIGIARRSGSGRIVLAPAVAWSVAAVVDLLPNVQFRLGGGYLLGSKTRITTIGATACYCP